MVVEKVSGKKITMDVPLWNRRTGQKIDAVSAPATVYGQYAVHRSVPNGDGWTVTHVPSGLSICVVDTQRMAREIAKACGVVACDATCYDEFSKTQIQALYQIQQGIRFPE